MVDTLLGRHYELSGLSAESLPVAVGELLLLSAEENPLAWLLPKGMPCVPTFELNRFKGYLLTNTLDVRISELVA